MRFLVTGGAGFIGSHVTNDLLSRGHNVVVLDNFSTGKLENLGPGCEIIEADITDPIRDRDFDAVFHLAAFVSAPDSIRDPDECFRVNVDGSKNVLDLGLPTVLASSAAVYGNKEGIAEECSALNPVSPYGESKLEMEEIARGSSGRVSLRFFNIYGPRQSASSKYSAVVPAFVTAMRKGAPYYIHGTGEQIRDFVYVEDLVEHIWQACSALIGNERKPIPSSLNVCSGIPTRIIDIARNIGEALRIESGEEGAPGDVVYAPERIGDIRTSLGSRLQWETFIGNTSNRTTAEGLRDLIKNMENGNA